MCGCNLSHSVLSCGRTSVKKNKTNSTGCHFWTSCYLCEHKLSADWQVSQNNCWQRRFLHVNNFTSLYVATLFNFILLQRFVHAPITKKHLFRVQRRSRVGVNYLLLSPRTQLEHFPEVSLENSSDVTLNKCLEKRHLGDLWPHPPLM